MKIIPLRKKEDFALAFNQGIKIVTRSLILFVAENKLKNNQTNGSCVQVGIIASKKIGSAVKRNRAKRRLRSASRIVLKSASLANYYVLIARKEVLGANFDNILNDLNYALKKHNKNFLCA